MLNRAETFKKTGIYRIYNKQTGKCYIGSALDLYTRCCVHWDSLSRGTHKNIKLQNSWKKHGADNFKFFVLEYVANKEFLIQREQHWINYFNSIDHGYNISRIAGNTIGFKHSEITKKKLSLFRTGTKASDQAKMKMSRSSLGRKQNQAWIKKSADARRGGKRSKETKEIFRKAWVVRRFKSYARELLG